MSSPSLSTESPSNAADRSLAAQVAEAARALGAGDQQDMIWGHVSQRDPLGRGLWMKASGHGFDEITTDRVLLIDLDGKPVIGAGEVHVEYPIHSEIYRARDDVNWVVHSHPAAVNVFTSLDIPLRAISHDAVPFCKPQLPRFTDGDLVTTQARGLSLAETLGAHIAALLPAHGLVCVGSTAAEAVMRAVLLTRACAMAVTAAAAGGPARWSDDAEVEAKLASAWPSNQLEAGYAYLLRQALSRR